METNLWRYNLKGYVFLNKCPFIFFVAYEFISSRVDNVTCFADGPWSEPRPRWLVTSSVPQMEWSPRSGCCPARLDCLEVHHQSHRILSQPGDLQRWQWSAWFYPGGRSCDCRARSHSRAFRWHRPHLGRWELSWSNLVVRVSLLMVFGLGQTGCRF